MAKLIYPQLSYKVIGAVFDAYKSLGGSYHEKYCQRAVAAFLKQKGLMFEREKHVQLAVGGVNIGKHFIDFVIEGKIILEVKKGNKIRMSDVKQVLMYLKSSRLKLGILAYFGGNGIKYKRIINSEVRPRE